MQIVGESALKARERRKFADVKDWVSSGDGISCRGSPRFTECLVQPFSLVRTLLWPYRSNVPMGCVMSIALGSGPLSWKESLSGSPQVDFQKHTCPHALLPGIGYRSIVSSDSASCSAASTWHEPSETGPRSQFRFTAETVPVRNHLPVA